MTPAQKEIYARCKARARVRLNWHDDFAQQLLQMPRDELAAAQRGHREGSWERIRDQAEDEERRRSKPLYSRRGM